MNKKLIPLAVTKALVELQKIVEDSQVSIEIRTDENLMNLECNFIDRKFFFKIDRYSNDNTGVVKYTYSFMPANEETFEPGKTTADFQQLKNHIHHWFTLLKNYHEIGSPFQNKFEKFYEAQFAEQIQVVDKNANTIPYDINTQQKLHGFLNQIILYLESTKSEENNEDYSPIISESKSLQNDMSKIVMNQVAKRFYSILAKLWKLGITVFEGALGNAAYDMVKHLLTQGN